MTTIPRLSFLALFAAGCAPTAFRADVGAAYIRTRGEVGLQNTPGNLVLGQEMNDVDDLGVGDSEGSPYLRFEADWDRHRVRAHGLGYDASGSGTLTGDFGDIPAGTAVSTKLSFFNTSAAWSYDLVEGPRFRLAPGVQAAFYSLDVTARSTSPSAFEKINTDVLVPMPYLEGEVVLDAFSIGASAGLMSAELQDATGRYWDVDLIARFRPGEHFELFGGYRYMLMDAHGEAGDRDFDADLEVFGWYLGLGVRF